MKPDDAFRDGFEITFRWLAPCAGERSAGNVIPLDPRALRLLPAAEWARQARRMAARRPSLAAALLRAAPLEIRQAEHPYHSTWLWLGGVSIAWRDWREGVRPAALKIKEHQLCL